MARIRERLSWALVAALSLLVLSAVAGLVSAGPLDPPGPVGPTDRTVITSLPFTVNQPGSYVLKSNLTGVSGQNGVTVSANNVTIDLQGFELAGVPGSLHGIAHTSGSLNGLAVRNGTIRNWGQLGISAGIGLLADGVVLKNNNGGVIASDGAALTNCRIDGSIGSAVILGNRAIVSKCTSDSNGTGCTTCPGIQAGQDSTITESIARNNGGNEIQAGAGSTLENCTADGQGTAGEGINVGADTTVRGCTTRNNGGDEISAGDRSLIVDCVADGWTGSARGPGNGLSIGNASVVRGCNVANNGAIGMAVFGTNNRIEGNHVRANDSYGFYVGGDGNVFAQNDSALNRGNTADDNCYLASGGNDFVIKTDATGAGAFDNLCD